jgi:hypothetical protein
MTESACHTRRGRLETQKANCYENPAFNIKFYTYHQLRTPVAGEVAHTCDPSGSDGGDPKA